MAKVINDSPELWAGTRTGRHNWNDYLNGQTWELQHGVDFTSKPVSMRAAASAAAAKAGKSVRTKLIDDGKKLIIKAFPKSAEIDAAEAADEQAE
ncbi:MAG TPA: hypothetical protein VIY48_17730 [Candidatus Paceibacterota bacterium]